LLLIPSLLPAQSQVRIGEVAGTQVRYLRERVPELASTHDSSGLYRIRQQLVNLPMVANARFEVDTRGADTTVDWTIDEARTVFPLLSFGGLRGNLFWLIGVKDINWRGRGNEIEAFYQNIQREHNFRLAYVNPHLGGGPWGYFAEVQRYAAREPLYFPQAVVYRYANLSLGAGVSLTPRTGLTYRLGANVFNERYRRLDDVAIGPASANLNKALVKLSRDADDRNYFGERQAGFYHTTIVQSVMTGGQATPFFIGWHELRYYRLQGGRGNWAARLRTGLSSNDDTPFAPFVLDSQFNIRGIGNRIDRGTAQLVFNLEYRHSILRGGGGRYVVQLVAFSDLGSWRSPGGELGELVRRGSIKHFVGGGLRLASPRISSAVLRVDYGVEVVGAERHGLVVGFGQFF
jgi:outer membrane protein assembly factor BamA